MSNNEQKKATTRKILTTLANETFKCYCPICKQWFDEMTNSQAKIHRQMCLEKTK